MLPDTHTQRVLGLASQKGLLRASDLDAIDAPRVVLTCGRRSNIDPPCRSNIDPGMEADRVMVDSGQV
ncbi:MAG: hypothetical protein B7X46_07010 [Thiomonas sp. 15-66-11]|nr:MAG: hypothetical protein B7X46_07010 [Thiomonas sp. 15-66-11]